MKRKFVSEKDFSEKWVEVNDTEYNILKEISRLHPQINTDLIYFNEEGKCTICVDRAESRFDKERGLDRYRISIEKIEPDKIYNKNIQIEINTLDALIKKNRDMKFEFIKEQNYTEAAVYRKLEKTYIHKKQEILNT